MPCLLCCARFAVCREAARRGGGGFVAPVQRVSDFMEGVESLGELPTSSYRWEGGGLFLALLWFGSYPVKELPFLRHAWWTVRLPPSFPSIFLSRGATHVHNIHMKSFAGPSMCCSIKIPL